MKLREWDWDLSTGGGDGHVQVDYPEGPIVDFLDWLRQTKAWHEDVEMVHRKLRNLNTKLAEFRQQAKHEAAAQAAQAAEQEARAQVARANLEKAREAKKRKRAEPITPVTAGG
jgi:hypothetical protein